MPRVVNPSFWASMVPRFLRRPTEAERAAELAKRTTAGAEERRIGLTFLFLGILVGSNAINILSLRREMLNFSRLTEAKLEKLREVVQRLKNGENVDVRKELGTGNREAEQEWEEVVKELGNTDMLAEQWNKRAAQRAEKQELRKQDKDRKHDERQRGQAAPTPTEARTEESSEAGKASRPKFLM